MPSRSCPKGGCYCSTTGTTWLAFNYDVDQHSSLSCLKVRQVDGTLKAVTMHGTACVGSVSSDGVHRMSEMPQVLQVLSFEFGWSVELFTGWSGFSAKNWNFHIGDASFNRGMFAKKSNVSGTQFASHLSASTHVTPTLFQHQLNMFFQNVPGCI